MNTPQNDGKLVSAPDFFSSRLHRAENESHVFIERPWSLLDMNVDKNVWLAASRFIDLEFGYQTMDCYEKNKEGAAAFRKKKIMPEFRVAP
jgi:hypothetical protein